MQRASVIIQTATVGGMLKTVTVDQTFDVVIRLYPGKAKYQEGEPVCQYLPWKNLIVADVTGADTRAGCLPHEFWQHRLPHVLFNDPNGLHHPVWKQVDTELQRFAWEDFSK